jgi:hypothetical protein
MRCSATTSSRYSRMYSDFRIDKETLINVGAFCLNFNVGDNGYGEVNLAWIFYLGDSITSGIDNSREHWVGFHGVSKARHPCGINSNRFTCGGTGLLTAFRLVDF